MAKKNPKTDKHGVMAASRISPAVIAAMRETIQVHAGCEVLFVCTQDEAGMLVTVVDKAHGNRGMVPVLNHEVAAGQVLVHNHPSGQLVPSDADVQVAARIAEQGLGSWIVNNTVERLYIVTEAWQPRSEQLLDELECAQALDADGALAKQLAHFSPRSGQIAMVRAVVRAFNTGTFLAVEAGTGVGKSYAYLVPAILWTAKNPDERIVVSTATINLQQQLVNKDIPAVSAFLGVKTRAVLAKGRGNYLCKKRLSESLDEEGLLLEPDGELASIADWSKNSRDGSRSELPFVPEEAVWARVNADADACPGLRCSLRDECFFFMARREAAAANIIVANHHLVLADAAMRLRGLGFDSTVVLPSFTRLVIDEAHNMESSATSYFSLTINRFSVMKYLAMLLRRRRGQTFGLLPQLERMNLLSLQHGEAMVEKARDMAYRVDAAGMQLLGSESSLRLLPGNRELYEDLRLAMSGLQAALEAFGEMLESVMDGIDIEEPSPVLQEFDLLVRRMLSMAKACESFRAFENAADTVHYLERLRSSGGEAAVQFVASPLDVGLELSASIFKPYRSVVLTSATLTVRHSFQHVLNGLGLRAKQSDPEQDVLELPDLQRQLVLLRVASPFDYERRVLLAVPQDAPDPAAPEYQEWLESYILSSLRMSGGRALVLFTSYDMLRKTWSHVAPQLADECITCLKQGDEERGRLLQRFNADIASCLFATDSFWEGVDSPGETLQLLILCKLPFRVPTDPLMLAKSERIEARGGRPFFELSLPEAVMKFRQGFGRLMRREDDGGVVMVTDRRLLTKSYGRVFLDSLPATARTALPSVEVVEACGTFLAALRRDA